jgi:hypothetical protein
VLRGFVWVVANVTIALAVVWAGLAAAVLFDPQGSSLVLEDVWLSVFVAAFLLPFYLPTVVLHGFLVPLLAPRLSARAASLVLAPIAPGLLWVFVFLVFDAVVLAIAVAGTVAYGVLARPQSGHPAGAIFAILTLMLLASVAFEDSWVSVMLLPFVAIAAWGYRRHLRTPAVP